MTKKYLSPLQSIRKYCVNIGSPNEVRNCTFINCELYPFRFGKNPNLKGKRGRSSEHMQRIRKKLKNSYVSVPLN